MSDNETTARDEDTIDVYIIEAETSPVRLHVNGRTVVIQVGVDSTIPAYFLPSLENATVKFRLSGDTPVAQGKVDPVPLEVTGIDQTDHSDGAAGEPKNGEGDSNTETEGDTFDPEPLIALTIEDFKKSIEETPLTAEQIQKVRDAETDREKPRAGIFAILDEAIAAQN